VEPLAVGGTSHAGTIPARSTSRTVLSVSVASHRPRHSGFPRADISLPFACTRLSQPTPLNLLPTCLPPRALPLQVRRSPLHPSPRRPSLPSTPPPSFPAPTRAPSHYPRPSHRAPVPCCHGLTAHPRDAFACSFASFRRVRSVSCVLYLLGSLVCTPPRVVRLFLCVAVRSPAPYPECPFIC
jgi:hypothetical protein